MFKLSDHRRYVLEMDPEARRTNEEVAAGVHWCDDWDGMVVAPHDQAFDACLCDLAYKRKLKKEKQ